MYVLQIITQVFEKPSPVGSRALFFCIALVLELVSIDARLSGYGIETVVAQIDVFMVELVSEGYHLADTWPTRGVTAVHGEHVDPFEAVKGNRVGLKHVWVL